MWIIPPGCRAQDDLDGPSNDPGDRPMLVGETITLRCRVKPGASVGTISWLEVTDGGSAIIFFGMNPGGGEKYENFVIDSVEGDDNWDLTIQNVETEDGGSYACQAIATGESDVAERIVESKCIFFVEINTLCICISIMLSQYIINISLSLILCLFTMGLISKGGFNCFLTCVKQVHYNGGIKSYTLKSNSKLVWSQFVK